ncbi:MAG TPA: hypothetical protein VIF60_23555 [Burkholderiaceae bacterium]|jgi:hypothetical protein
MLKLEMLNWKAVFLGAIADFVGTIFVTILVGQAWVGALQLGGASGDSAREMTSNSHLFLAICVTIGWYFDYLAGRIAASLAEDRGALHGVAAVVPGVVFGLFEAVSAASPEFPLWFDIALCLASIGFGYYGGSRGKPIKKS